MLSKNYVYCALAPSLHRESTDSLIYGAIVRRVAVRQAELAMGNHPCSPGECLVVECWVWNCPIERPAVGYLVKSNPGDMETAAEGSVPGGPGLGAPPQEGQFTPALLV